MPASVQADLLRIGGTNDYGEPKIRLVWGEEATHFRWGKERLKYPIKRKLRRLAAWNVVNTSTGAKFNFPAGPEPVFSSEYLIAPVWEDREIGYRGWILEEWWPPELVCLNWELNRWFQPRNEFGKPDGEPIDVLGEPPTRGQYRFVMYCDDQDEVNPTPLDITDHRLIEIVEAAIRLRVDQGAADGWRKIQDPTTAARMYAHIQRDRQKLTEEEDKELEEFVTETVKGYARKLRHAYLS